MSLHVLHELQEWYNMECDGSWEHIYGIHIDTLDNPGWKIAIDLAETKLEGQHFDELKVDNGGTEWFTCCVKDNVFRGYGGPSMLTEIVRQFLNWAKCGAQSTDERRP